MCMLVIKYISIYTHTRTHVCNSFGNARGVQKEDNYSVLHNIIWSALSSDQVQGKMNGFIQIPYEL